MADLPKKTKEDKTKEFNNIRSYSFFVVFNNPRTHGIAGIIPEEMKTMSNEEVCKLVAEGFCNRASKQAVVLYCKSAAGMEHIHAIFSSDNQFRLGTLKNYLGRQAHIQITRGSKEQAEAYINKTGKFEESGEKVLAKFQIGEVKGRQGKRSDIDCIRTAVDTGLTWKEIRRLNDRFYDSKYTSIIKNMFYDKREQETPFKREVNVHWLVGESGSGKTGVIYELIEKYGEDNVYLVSDYQNPFDGYAGEPVIILDEYRGQLPYATLLGMLEGYKKEIHCRYANVVGLWTEVYITTIKTPEEVYAKMIDKEDAETDPISQLLSRIKTFNYCYRVNRISGSKLDRDGQLCDFFRYTIDGQEYREMKGNKMEQVKRAAEVDYRIMYQQKDDRVEAFSIYPPKHKMGEIL